VSIILGNIFSFLASVCDGISASRKTHRSIFLVQILSQTLYGITGIVLKVAFLVSVLLFAIFNAVILNLAGAVSNLVLFVVSAVFLIQALRRQ